MHFYGNPRLETISFPKLTTLYLLDVRKNPKLKNIEYWSEDKSKLLIYQLILQWNNILPKKVLESLSGKDQNDVQSAGGYFFNFTAFFNFWNIEICLSIKRDVEFLLCTYQKFLFRLSITRLYTLQFSI